MYSLFSRVFITLFIISVLSAISSAQRPGNTGSGAPTCCTEFFQVQNSFDEVSTGVKYHDGYAYLTSYLLVNSQPKAVLTKVDVNGDIVWRRQQTMNSVYNDLALVEEAGDVNIYLGGRTADLTTNSDNAALFTKINANGTLAWNRVHDAPGANEDYEQVVYSKSRTHVYLLRSVTPLCNSSAEECGKYTNIDRFDNGGSQLNSWRYRCTTESGPSPEQRDLYITALTTSGSSSSFLGAAGYYEIGGVTYPFFTEISNSNGFQSRRKSLNTQGVVVKDMVSLSDGYVALLEPQAGGDQYFYGLSNFFQFFGGASLAGYDLPKYGRMEAASNLDGFNSHEGSSFALPLINEQSEKPAFVTLTPSNSAQYQFNFSGVVDLLTPATDPSGNTLAPYASGANDLLFHSISGNENNNDILSYGTTNGTCFVDTINNAFSTLPFVGTMNFFQILPPENLAFNDSIQSGQIFSAISYDITNGCGIDLDEMEPDCCDELKTADNTLWEIPTRVKFKDNYSIVASYEVSGTTPFATLTKLDINGNIVWRNRQSISSVYHDFAIATDNSIYLVGLTGLNNHVSANVDTKSWICKIDASGNLVHSETYDSQNEYEEFSAILLHPTPKDTLFPIYVVGTRRGIVSFGDGVPYIYNFGTNLTVNWRRTYTYTNPQSSSLALTLTGITTAPNKNITVVGNTYTSGEVIRAVSFSINGGSGQQSSSFHTQLQQNYYYYNDIVKINGGYIAFGRYFDPPNTKNGSAKMPPSDGVHFWQLNDFLGVVDHFKLPGVSYFNLAKFNPTGNTDEYTLPLKINGSTIASIATISPASFIGTNPVEFMDINNNAAEELQMMDYMVGSSKETYAEARVAGLGGGIGRFQQGYLLNDASTCYTPRQITPDPGTFTTEQGTWSNNNSTLTNATGTNTVSIDAATFLDCLPSEPVELCPGTYPIVTAPRFIIPTDMCSSTSSVLTVVIKNALGVPIGDPLTYAAGSPVLINLDTATTPPGRYFICITDENNKEKVVAVETRSS